MLFIMLQAFHVNFLSNFKVIIKLIFKLISFICLKWIIHEYNAPIIFDHTVEFLVQKLTMEEEERQMPNEHQLWVNLSSLGDGNVFAYLSKLMEQLLSDEYGGEEGNENYDLVFPSDEAWKTKIYLKMLAKQRMMER